jgi:hypothetical protein
MKLFLVFVRGPYKCAVAEAAVLDWTVVQVVVVDVYTSMLYEGLVSMEVRARVCGRERESERQNELPKLDQLAASSSTCYLCSRATCSSPGRGLCRRHSNPCRWCCTRARPSSWRRCRASTVQMGGATTAQRSNNEKHLSEHGTTHYQASA